MPALRERILAILEESAIPGASVAVHYQGRPLWIEGFGMANPKTRLRTGEHTIFSLQSASKNFTATAIMLAVQEGLLDLDLPVTQYLPDFSVNSRLEAAPQQKMTLRLLLSHRAGFTHEAPLGNNFDLECPSFEAHVQSISQTWLRYPVGERYSYSNLGVDLAGYVLQTVTRTPFPEWLKARLFDPLGMHDTTATQDEYVTRGDRAVGHAPGFEVVPARIPIIPSGGVYSSAADMARYVEFHLGKGSMGGRTLLRRELWEEMHAFPYGGQYSLGVTRIARYSAKGTLRVLNHNGGGFGFGATCNYCPQTHLAWVVLWNGTTRDAADPYNPLQRFVWERLESMPFPNVYGARPLWIADQRAPLIELTPERLRHYEGHYLGGGMTAEGEIQNETFGLKLGSDFHPLRFTSSDQAWLPIEGITATVRFHPARGDEAPHLELVETGQHLDYNNGPSDPPGTVGSEFDQYLGTYEGTVWGKPWTKMLSKRNGYLYLDDRRLTPHLPGLWFTADGEALDLRLAQPTFRSIRIKRVLGG